MARKVESTRVDCVKCRVWPDTILFNINKNNLIDLDFTNNIFLHDTCWQDKLHVADFK